MMDTLPPLYVCGYKDCQTNPSKKINIERHIWLVHVRETMSCQHMKYNCSQHKNLVTPYVRCVRESKRGLKKLRNLSKDSQPGTNATLRHTNSSNRASNAASSIRPTQSVPSISYDSSVQQSYLRSSMSPKRQSSDPRDSFASQRYSDDHFDVKLHPPYSKPIEEIKAQYSDNNVLLNTRSGLTSDMSRFHSEPYIVDSPMSVYARSTTERDDTHMSKQVSTPTRRLTASESEFGTSIWRPW